MQFHYRCAVIFFLSGLCSVGRAETPQNILPIKGLEPAVTEVHSARDSGSLEEIAIELGSQVKVGDILVKLDHERQLAAYEAAKLRANSRAGVEIGEGLVREKNATLNLALYRFRRRQIAEEEVEKAQGQAQVAKGQLESSRLALELAKLDLDLAEKLLEKRFVRATMAGTVTAIAKTKGSRVNQGDALVTVSDLSNASTKLSVTAASLKVLQVGQSLPVRLAGANIVHQAKIADISPLEGGKNGEQSVKLVFDNLQPDQTLADQSAEVMLPDGAHVAPYNPPAPKKK